MATSLLGDDMYKNWFAKFFRLSKSSLHRDDVMSIDWTDIFKSEIFKHSLRGNDVLDALLHAMKSLVDRRTDNGSLGENFLAPI